MQRIVRASQVDCIASIAAREGFHPDTIWDDPRNTQLRQRRQDAYLLKEGDEVAIPDRRRRIEEGATEVRHGFVRKGVPEKLELVILDSRHEPRRNVNYELVVGTDVHRGTTDADGRIRAAIPPDVTRATLVVPGTDHDPDDEYSLQLGRLVPVDGIEGLQMRLRNLGFDPGPLDGLLGPRTRDALRRFQVFRGLEATGEPSDETRDALVRAHGS